MWHSVVAKDIVQERHVAVRIISATASKKFDTFKTFYYLPSGDDRVPQHSGRNNVVGAASSQYISKLAKLSAGPIDS